jgi:putative transposase
VRDFEQRHAGDDRALLFSRLALYAKARECDAARWSGNTRNWTPVGAVMHTPECDSVDAMASLAADKQPLAARMRRQLA